VVGNEGVMTSSMMFWSSTAALVERVCELCDR
jgi:hypothetical protein